MEGDDTVDGRSVVSSSLSKDLTITTDYPPVSERDATDKSECFSPRIVKKIDTPGSGTAGRRTTAFSSTTDLLSHKGDLLVRSGEASRRTWEVTSSRTRERLTEVEKQLTSSRLRTSTRTRQKLALAEEELARLNMGTSSVTRENLGKVDSAIRREREKKLSTKTLAIFHKKQELLHKLLAERSNVDVAFLVDCTGSMSGFIEGTKRDIEDIVNNIIYKFENNIRLAFVGYRDHCDGEARLECLEFTERVDDFKSFVANIHAKGGGDGPEDVLGGLESILSLSWSSKNKVLFHIGDAPQHGGRFHNMGPSADNHYNIEPRGLQAEDLLKNLAQSGIKYYFGKIKNSTDKMIQVFQSIIGETNLIVTDIKNPDLLKGAVVESVTTTIDFSLSKTVHGRALQMPKSQFAGITEESESGKTLKDFSISDVEPDYSCMKADIDVKWLECHIPTLDSLANLKDHIGNINHKWTTTTVKRAKDPFSQGEQRISYHGFRRIGTHDEQIVLKEFKHVGKGRDRREDYIQIMETQAVAAFMAHEFNKISPPGSKEIQFLHVSVMQIFQLNGAPKYYNVELLLPDYKSNFQKWNSNAGYVSDAIYSKTLDAFSHWSYDITDGFLIVVDLQGVERDKMYVLTDPSINCMEPRFGLTNIGELGIKMFFRTHSCSDVCKAMGLKKQKYMRDSTPARGVKAVISELIGWT